MGSGIKRILSYLNPIEHLGDRRYSIVFPLVFTIGMAVAIEFIVYDVVKDVKDIGLYAIFVFIALIVYFAFREGIRGGVIASGITVLYYLFLIYSLHYHGEQFTSGIETTIILGVLYLVLSATIGWLKETIDRLIEREADERRRLEAVIQQLPVGALITDRYGKLTHRNRRIDEILGVKIPTGFFFGRDTIAKQQIDEDEIHPSQSPIFKALVTGKSVVGREFVFDRQDAKRFYLRVSSSPVKNRAGKTIAAVSIIQDITSQKELESRKDDFINMASHELKTPITSLILYLDSLTLQLKKYNDERAHKTVRNIKNQTRKLQGLVTDLLDVSRIQTGKLSFNKEVFELNGLIEETIEGLYASVRQEIVFTKRTPVKVFGDRFRIYQVLTNLITNAAKFSPENTQIIVSISRSKGKALVSVKDFGVGIVPDQQKKIFERLYQVHHVQEKMSPGFGMGLYISKEIIKRHHGTINVKSEKGKGATFTFSLPIGKKVRNTNKRS